MGERLKNISTGLEISTMYFSSTKLKITTYVYKMRVGKDKDGPDTRFPNIPVSITRHALPSHAFLFLM